VGLEIEGFWCFVGFSFLALVMCFSLYTAGVARGALCFL
jgi:hypothetical protein